MLGINQNLANPACRKLSFKMITEVIETSELSPLYKRTNFNVISDDGKSTPYEHLSPSEKIAFDLGALHVKSKNTPWAKRFEKFVGYKE